MTCRYNICDTHGRADHHTTDMIYYCKCTESSSLLEYEVNLTLCFYDTNKLCTLQCFYNTKTIGYPVYDIHYHICLATQAVVM